jgi:hypothetical protein
MYFPYPDKGGPSLKGVGAYHAARASAPVATAGLGQSTPAGYAPIRAPWFVQEKPWPYILGPNYTRPVFKEHSSEGNFVPYPIVRMPSLNGLGEASPQSVCEPMQAMPDAHSRCVQFNNDLVRASETKRAEMMAQIAKAEAACGHVSEFEPWARCYYGHLQPAWYENPWYLGGAIIGGSAALSLIVLAIRRTAE